MNKTFLDLIQKQLFHFPDLLYTLNEFNVYGLKKIRNFKSKLKTDKDWEDYFKTVENKFLVWWNEKVIEAFGNFLNRNVND